MDIEFNNVDKLDTHDTGWFVGFSDWAKAKLTGVPDMRYIPREQRVHTLCMKWMRHRAQDPRGQAKPPSTGRTISLLVSESGRFRLEFSACADFPADGIVRHVLQCHGDFVVWGENLYHRWFVDQDCTILTLRWTPE